MVDSLSSMLNAMFSLNTAGKNKPKSPILVLCRIGWHWTQIQILYLLSGGTTDMYHKPWQDVNRLFGGSLKLSLRPQYMLGILPMLLNPAHNS